MIKLGKVQIILYRNKSDQRKSRMKGLPLINRSNHQEPKIIKAEGVLP